MSRLWGSGLTSSFCHARRAGVSRSVFPDPASGASAQTPHADLPRDLIHTRPRPTEGPCSTTVAERQLFRTPAADGT